MSQKEVQTSEKAHNKSLEIHTLRCLKQLSIVYSLGNGMDAITEQQERNELRGSRSVL